MNRQGRLVSKLEKWANRQDCGIFDTFDKKFKTVNNKNQIVPSHKKNEKIRKNKNNIYT